MLQKEELRIGNYIIGKKVNDHTDIPEKVLALTPDGIATIPFSIVATGKGYESIDEIDKKRTLPYSWAEGEPVTTDWVLRFGFSLESRDYQIYSKGGWKIRFFNGQCLMMKEQNQIGEPLLFVHQLQNLYFALTGQILTLPS
jgi:hypothetical protein